LVEKSNGKTRRRMEDNIKMDINEMMWDNVDLVYEAQTRVL
jgi:hypothetical protein